MKNKFWVRSVSLLLLMAVLISSAVILSGCNDTSTSATSDIKVQTISLRGIKEKGTTDESIALVEKAMNKITKSLYNIRVVLELYTEDEYYDVLEKTMTQRADIVAKEKAEADAIKAAKESEAKAAKASAALTSNNSHWVKPATTEAVSVEETQRTTIDENGKVQVLYPDLETAQIDIIYLGGYDRYTDYVQRELLTSLDEYLSGTFKSLSKYINSIFLNAAKLDTGSYAVLNSHSLGDSKYLVVDKELATKYGFQESDFSTAANCEKFLAQVASGETGIVPFYAQDTSVPAYAYLFGEDVMIGGYIPPKTKSDIAIRPRSLMLDTNKYTEHIITMDNYRKAGYLRTELAEGQKYAAGIIESNEVDIKAMKDQYYTVLIESPMATRDKLYSSMFAISSYSEHSEAAMQVISLLNTNEEFRNLFQYGIEGTHYELVDGKVSRLRSDYMMDINKTGNVFLAHPEEYMNANEIEVGKAQNVIAVMDPYMNFTFSEEKYADDIAEVKRISATLFEGLKTTDNVAAYVEYARGVIDGNAAFQHLTDADDENSLLSEYLKWQEQNFKA